MNKFYETLTNLRGDVLFGYRTQVVDPTGAIVDIYKDRNGTRFTDSSGNIVNYAEASTDTGMAEFYWTAATGHILQITDSSGELARPPIIGVGDNYVLGNLSGDLPTTAIDGLDATLAAKADTTYVDTGLAEKVPTADLASTDTGKGAAMVKLTSGGDVQEAIQYVTPEMFGAAADGITDDKIAIDAAIAFVAANSGTHLLFNQKSYATSGTVDLTTVKVTVSRGATIVPTHDGTAVQYAGASGTIIQSPRLEGNLRVAWATVDWTKDRLAFLIQNCYFGVFGVSWYNATRGIKVHGNGTGCVYNEITIGEGFRANVGIWLSSETATGWSNANKFSGGRLYGARAVAGSLYEAQAGHICFDDSLYQSNGNEFDLSLEWSGTGFRLARMGGIRNRLYPRYAELDSGDTTWIVDTGTENLIDCEGVAYLAGYDPSLAGSANRVDVSGATRPMVRGQQSYFDAGGTGADIRKVQSTTRPAIWAQNSGSGAAVRAQNTSSGANPALEVVGASGGAGVSIPAAGTWTVFNGTKKVAWSSAIAPSTGAWTRGDIAWITNPSTGGPVGWICTASGTPGTWVPLGIAGASRAAAVTDPAGGTTVDTECRAQLAALIDSLQAAGLMA